MASVELDDLWNDGRPNFTVEEENQLWNLLKVKLKRTLTTFHVLSRILYGAPARHTLTITPLYSSAITRLDRAFQDFISCRKVYLHSSPRPSRRDVDAIQDALSVHYERHIGPLGAEESHRRRIRDLDATVRLLNETVKEGYRYMRAKGFRKVDWLRSVVLAADDGLICMREVYGETKRFLVGEQVSHDWLVEEMSALGMEEHLGTFLEEMDLVDRNGKLICDGLVNLSLN